jgi:hypothetical protein
MKVNNLTCHAPGTKINSGLEVIFVFIYKCYDDSFPYLYALLPLSKFGEERRGGNK